MHNTNYEWLIRQTNHNKMTTTVMYDALKKVKIKLKLNHTIHECRHTFRIRLYNLNVDSVTINTLMGRKSNNIGENVYTHKTIEQLKTAINLLN